MIAKSEFAQIHRQSLAEDEGSFAIPGADHCQRRGQRRRRLRLV
jgi:hypothetical protein